MKFEDIRNQYPDWGSAFPENWEKPTIAEIESIESEFGIKYSSEFKEFQLKDCHITPMGGEAWDGYGWANPSLEKLYNLKEVVKGASIVGVPKNLAPFREENGDFYCEEEDGKIGIWDHNTGLLETDENYKWKSFVNWLSSTLEEE